MIIQENHAATGANFIIAQNSLLCYNEIIQDNHGDLPGKEVTIIDDDIPQEQNSDSTTNDSTLPDNFGFSYRFLRSKTARGIILLIIGIPTTWFGVSNLVSLCQTPIFGLIWLPMFLMWAVFTNTGITAIIAAIKIFLEPPKSDSSLYS